MDAILSSFVTQPGAPLVQLDYECNTSGVSRILSQRRFLLSAEPRRATSWVIPVCSRGEAHTAKICAIIPQGQSQTLHTGDDARVRCQTPWAFLNAGATGYSRTAYPPDLLAAMAPRVSSALSDAERLSLLSDEWALVRAARHHVGVYLTLLERLRERELECDHRTDRPTPRRFAGH